MKRLARHNQMRLRARPGLIKSSSSLFRPEKLMLRFKFCRKVLVPYVVKLYFQELPNEFKWDWHFCIFVCTRVIVRKIDDFVAAIDNAKNK